jgi:hypothetical protein
VTLSTPEACKQSAIMINFRNIRVLAVTLVVASVSFSFSDSTNSTSAYYSIRPDLRRCASPLCGGFFVKRVNQSVTRCSDDRQKPECYVAEIDWNNQPQVEPSRGLVRGDLTSKQFGHGGRLGVLRVTESWQSHSDKTAVGVFYRVRDLGVRCIAAPCKTHHEAKLNSTIGRDVAGVDLSATGANDDQIGQANAAMTGAEGILAAGSHSPVSGPAGKAEMLKATQFYLRAAKEVSSKRCIKTGCSGQVCADRDVITTCIYRAEYECYQQAKCERQSDGKCGFTMTAELRSCLRRK